MTRTDRYVADCYVRAATDLLAHTWDPVVLAALHQGPRRRSVLRAEIGGISDKVLTEALTRLRAAHLVERDDRAYGLTELGRSLVEGPLRELGRWAREHGDELLDGVSGGSQVG